MEGKTKDDFYDSSLPLEELINSKPKRVQEDQWKELVTSWNKEESKILSEKNKANREKKKMVQVTGKKSYVRIREELKDSLGRDPSRMEMFCACFSNDGNGKNMEDTNAIKLMEELNSQLPEGYVDNPSPGNIFSKVIGEDKHGEERMFGLGVRGSYVWGLMPSRPSRRENMNWKSAYERVSGEVADLKAMFLNMHETSGDTLNDSSVPVRFPNSRVVANQPLALRVGVVVYLKNILNSTEIVAKGRIKSLNPKELVGGEETRPNWCEVNVLTAIKRNERVVSPYDLIVTLQDAIGATVAWPCPFISVVPMEDA